MIDVLNVVNSGKVRLGERVVWWGRNNGGRAWVCELFSVTTDGESANS